MSSMGCGRDVHRLQSSKYLNNINKICFMKFSLTYPSVQWRLADCGQLAVNRDNPVFPMAICINILFTPLS